MSLVSIKDVKKSFGPVAVLKGVSIEIARGDVVAIIGRSGSGKSTLLRCINGLETYEAGSIEAEASRSAAARPAWSSCAAGSAWCSSNSTCFRI
jgi:polar amino acid transport system ATP-binding protein